MTLNMLRVSFLVLKAAGARRTLDACQRRSSASLVDGTASGAAARRRQSRLAVDASRQGSGSDTRAKPTETIE